jgi:hypothetical protein
MMTPPAGSEGSVKTEGLLDDCSHVGQLDGLVVLNRRGESAICKSSINLSPDFRKLVRVLHQEIEDGP